MTEVTIIKVDNGAVYQGLIYDYWVVCRFKDDIFLVLFDYKPIDLTNWINKKVNITISALFVQKEEDNELRSFKGKILQQNKGFFFVNDFIEISLAERDIIENKILLNVEGIFYFGRLDIDSVNELNNEKPH